jgi:hypothetical protein
MTSRLPANACLVGLAPVALVTLVALVAVPQSLSAPASAVLLPVAVAVLLALYAAVGWALRRRPWPGDATGAAIGVLAGALWSCEIFIGGPARVSHATERALGGTFLLAATIVTLSASSLAAPRNSTGTRRWRAGVFAGVTSALVVFVFSVSMTLLTLGTLAMRSDYRHQFIGSGAHTIHAFLVQDILVAASAHMLINVILGLAGAGIAIAVAATTRATLRRDRPSPGPRATPPS